MGVKDLRNGEFTDIVSHGIQSNRQNLVFGVEG